jgi:aminopeptidase N
MVLTNEGLEWLENVWRRQEKLERLMFAEADEISMAIELAIRQVRGWPAILEQQLERTEDADRRARLAFVVPALSSDDSVRERAFDRFWSVENRQREPWVLESQRYLHHPLRQSHATRLIRPSLELLGEIQRTGDIFFPLRWLEATFAGHSSQEAATIVEGFLAENPQYPVRLRWAILSAADHLLRLIGT